MYIQAPKCELVFKLSIITIRNSLLGLPGLGEGMPIWILNFHQENNLKAYSRSDLFFFILKGANIRCFILFAVEIFYNIIRI